MHQLDSKIGSDYKTVPLISLKLLCGKLTFISVRGIRVWVSAQSMGVLKEQLHGQKHLRLSIS